MSALLKMFPLALEGQWHGAAAVALVLVGVVIFIGTIYVLLASIYGWLQGYLVTMVSLTSFSMLLSAVWLVGIPGTIPGTGPRGTEPHWVLFLPDSEQGQEFAKDIASFPANLTPSGGWRAPNAEEAYPGNISGEGEISNIQGVMQPALAAYFQKQKTGSSNPIDYQFRIAGRQPQTADEAKLPGARIFFLSPGPVSKIDPTTKKTIATYPAPPNAPQELLVGISLPEAKDATGKTVHPAVTVFGYRNKGRVFQASAEWLLITIILWALHLWWLARYEKRAKRREEELAAGTSRQPVTA